MLVPLSDLMSSTAAFTGAMTLLLTWLLGCFFLYRRARHLPWLTATDVAGCLALLGMTVFAAFHVPRTVVLAPLAGVILILAATHLTAARRSAREVVSSRYGNAPSLPQAAEKHPKDSLPI